MNIIRCKESDLDELYNESALTFEGTTIDDDNLNFLKKWLEDHDCKMKTEDFYVVSGKLMNDYYKLTGSNAYKDELNILAIKLSDLTNINSIVMAVKFELGGRWFDDVVNNNRMREL